MAKKTHDKKWPARIGAAGRIVIPRQARELLDLRQGQRVLLQVRDGALEISTRGGLARAQAIAHRHPAPGGNRLSESLIRDRRKAAARGD